MPELSSLNPIFHVQIYLKTYMIICHIVGMALHTNYDLIDWTNKLNPLSLKSSILDINNMNGPNVILIKFAKTEIINLEKS